MSGGKGGSQTSEVEIPSWIEDPAQRFLQRAEDASQIGYMPYYGMDVAALTPMQQVSMQNTVDAAGAFGLASPGMDAMFGMPTPTDFGNGMQGYSSGPMFQGAVDQAAQAAPGFMDAYNQLFASNQVPGQTGRGLETYANADTDRSQFGAGQALPGFQYDPLLGAYVPTGYTPPTGNGFLI